LKEVKSIAVLFYWVSELRTISILFQEAGELSAKNGRNALIQLKLNPLRKNSTIGDRDQLESLKSTRIQRFIEGKHPAE
jgi:hypothetical protein